jgi:hypothetical protein
MGKQKSGNFPVGVWLPFWYLQPMKRPRKLTDPDPYPHAYWVLPGILMAGGYPGSKFDRLAGFLDLRISLIIDLMEKGEKDQFGVPYAQFYSNLYLEARRQGNNISISRKPIPYLDIPSPRKMKAILDKIDIAISRDRRVYVYSRTGRGRAGLVVGCYLVRRGMTGKEALRQIKTLRREVLADSLPSPEADDQRDMVLNWKG